MKQNCFNRLVMTSPTRLAMPIATYPALHLTGATVKDIVTRPEPQVEAQAVLQKRHPTPFVLTAMDLSAEAEAFGCALEMSDHDVPSVTGRLITSLEEAKALELPIPGAARTEVYLEAVRQLRKRFPDSLVFGSAIGPFSLASRLAGVSEALELTAADPELMHVLTEKCAGFLASYLRAYKTAGADGVLMAEPTAGLLSPQALGTFSSAYVKQINLAVADGHFALILHNCGARLAHLPAILESGLKTFHFGAPMDLPAALAAVPPETVICGNLDPGGVFCQCSPGEVTTRTRELMVQTAAYRNFVVSSGCDVPPNAPLANLDAFFAGAAAVPDVH
jgi:uroporphyrinogen decarboxylase